MCALAAATSNALLLDSKPRDAGREVAASPLGLGWFWHAASAPLFVTALSFGVVNSVYWSFAVDLISRAGGYSSAAGPAFYAILGTFGFAGLFTGDAVARFGLRRVLLATLISLGVAAGLLGLAPGWTPLVGLSAVLFGSGVMVMSALLSIWSSAVFAERPSVGFSATLVLFGIGSAAGPGVAGALAGHLGLERVFMLAATLSLLTAFVRPASGGPLSVKQ